MFCNCFSHSLITETSDVHKVINTSNNHKCHIWFDCRSWITSSCCTLVFSNSLMTPYCRVQSTAWIHTNSWYSACMGKEMDTQPSVCVCVWGGWSLELLEEYFKGASATCIWHNTCWLSVEQQMKSVFTLHRFLIMSQRGLSISINWSTDNLLCYSALKCWSNF